VFLPVLLMMYIVNVGRTRWAQRDWLK